MNAPGKVHYKAFQKAFRGFGSATQPVEWARANFRLSTEYSSVQGRFVSTPYQDGMLALMASDFAPDRVCMMKSARIGFTVVLLSSLCFFFGRARRHVAVYQPSDEAANKFSKTTVMPALRDCDMTADLMEEEQDKRTNKTYSLMRLGGKYLRITGAVSPSRFREYTADVVILDELDGLKRDVGKEGSPVFLAARAIRNSPFRRLLYGGTPTTVGDSVVHKEYMDSELRLRFFVPCPHCGHMDWLKWPNFKFDSKNPSLEARMQCEDCGRLWRYKDLPRVLKKGRWQVGAMKDDGFGNFNADGEIKDEDLVEEPFAHHWLDLTEAGPMLVSPEGGVVEWPERIAMHINSLYSPFWPWEKTKKEFIESRGDPMKYKTWLNLTLGEPWREQDQMVYVKDLQNRRKRLLPLPKEVTRIIAGVDVQQEYLSVLVTGWTAREEAYVLERHEFHGRVSIPDAAGWVQFQEWLSSKPTWDIEDGTLNGIDGVVVDSGHWTDAVYGSRMAIQKAVGRRTAVMIVKGNNVYQSPIVKPSKGTGKAARYRVSLFMVGAFMAGRAVLQMLVNQRVHINEAVPDDALEEMAAMTLQRRKDWKTNRNPYYLAKLGARNEAFDCLVYSLAMLKMIGGKFRPRRVKPPQEAPEKVEEAPETPADEDEERVQDLIRRNLTGETAKKRPKRSFRRPKRRTRW